MKRECENISAARSARVQRDTKRVQELNPSIRFLFQCLLF